jgi:hypothetical protein
VLEIQRRRLGVRLDLRLVVGVDEGHVNRSPAGAVTKRNWSPSGTDCSTIARQRRQVLLDRTLERARAELRAETLVDEERVRDSSTSTAHGLRAGHDGRGVREPCRGAPASPPARTDGTRPPGRSSSEPGRNDARTARSIPAEENVAPLGSKPTRGLRGRPDIGRQYDDAASEVDLTPLEVRQAAVVEDLQEDVAYGLCGLLELVEQDHRERDLADRRDQRRTVPVDDGVAQQPVERLLRLVLAHVEPDQSFRRAEEEFGERLRDLGLPCARGAYEQEDAEGPCRIGDPALIICDPLDDTVDRFALLQNTPVEECTDSSSSSGAPASSRASGSPSSRRSC